MKIKSCKICKSIMERKGTMHFCKCGVVYLGIAEAWHFPEGSNSETLL